MIVDCATCVMRELACGDCVVTMLLGPIELDEHRKTLDVLHSAGLVKPLRLVHGHGDEVADASERQTG
jgi:hypothetical protein